MHLRILVFFSGIHYPLVTASATGSSPNLLETSMLAGGRSRPGTAAGVDPDSGHDDEELVTTFFSSLFQKARAFFKMKSYFDLIKTF